MNKLLTLILLSLLTLYVPVSAKQDHLPYEKHDAEHEASYQKIARYVARYKSFMQGISEGFYEDPQYIDNNSCLDDDAVETLHSIFESMRHGANWFDKMLRVITAMMTFNSSVKETCNEA